MGTGTSEEGRMAFGCWWLWGDVMKLFWESWRNRSVDSATQKETTTAGVVLPRTGNPLETDRTSTGRGQEIHRQQTAGSDSGLPPPFCSFPLAHLWQSLTKPNVIFPAAALGSQWGAGANAARQRVRIPGVKGLPEVMLTRLRDSRQSFANSLCDVMSNDFQWWASASQSMDHYSEARWGWKLVIHVREAARLITKQPIFPLWSRKSLLCLIFIKLWNEVSAAGISLIPAQPCSGGSLAPVSKTLALQSPRPGQECTAQIWWQLSP